MTQEQRTPEAIHEMAADICRKIYGEDERAWPDGLCNSIDQAIAAAIRAENAACAKVAEDMRPAGGRAWDVLQHKCFAALTDCAAAIRARAP